MLGIESSSLQLPLFSLISHQYNAVNRSFEHFWLLYQKALQQIISGVPQDNALPQSVYICIGIYVFIKECKLTKLLKMTTLSEIHQEDKGKIQKIKQLLSILQVQVTTHLHLPMKD